jgi:predicted NAD/FAD-dependent oxidoreductase
MTALVVGGGISGVSCAAAMSAAGVDVQLRDRGHVLGGRMMSRTLRGTDTAFDGRVVDIGASYLTAVDPRFKAAVDRLVERGVLREWTDTFHVAGPEGIEAVSSGPMRYAAPNGLRSVVSALADEVENLDVATETPVDSITVDGGSVSVDGTEFDGVAVCAPIPQARRLIHIDVAPIAWQPVIEVTCVFGRRYWIDLDGVFINDDPVITWIADDGRRRGDDAPVLVAHVHPVLSARHLDDPTAVIPAVVAAIQRALAVAELPEWVEVHRWSFAKPLYGRFEPHWLDRTAPVGVAGDEWAGGPRVEAAWLSGLSLGRALAERIERTA